MLVRASGDRLLEESGGNCFLGAAKPVHFFDQSESAQFELTGQKLDVIAPRQRVGGAGDAGLVRNDLLRAKGQTGSVGGRTRKRLVVPVGVEGLRASQCQIGRAPWRGG